MNLQSDVVEYSWILMYLMDGMIELSQMNLGKVGEPYCYPDSFIDF